MGFLWLFDTCGPIVAIAIWAAGLLTIALCIWASRRSSPPRTRRLAVTLSFLPLVVAICGALFGLVFWLASQPTIQPQDAWPALGKVCLAGLAVTSLPFLWSVLLLRSQRRMA